MIGFHFISIDRAEKGAIKRSHIQNQGRFCGASCQLALCQTFNGQHKHIWEESLGEEREELPPQTFSVVCNCVECG